MVTAGMVACEHGQKTTIDCTIGKAPTGEVIQGGVTRRFGSAIKSVLAFPFANDEAVRLYRPVKILTTLSVDKAWSSILMS